MSHVVGVKNRTGGRVMLAGVRGRRGAQVVGSTFDEDGRLIMTLDDGSTVDGGINGAFLGLQQEVGDGLGDRYTKTESDQKTELAASGVLDEVDRAGGSEYLGVGPIFPIATDQDRRAVLAYDAEKKRIVGAGVVGVDEVDQQLQGTIGDQAMFEYVGAGPVYPLLLGVDRRVLLGYDAGADRIVGAGLQPAPLEQGAAAINHLLFYGQSLSVGATATTIISVAQPYNNVTFSGGPRAWTGLAFDFSSLKPLVEDNVNPAPDGSSNRGETPCSGAANYASNLLYRDAGIAPADHVILASTAGKGGASILELKKGTSWYNNFLAHVQGGLAQGQSYVLRAFCWAQGESNVSMDYATYRAELEQLQVDIDSDARAMTGQQVRVACITYQLSYRARAYQAVPLAQLSLAQNNPYFYLATPTYHLPYGPDNVHLTNVGYKWLGAYYGRVYKKIIAGDLGPDKQHPWWLNPVSAVRSGTTVTLRFDVPTAPLVFDTVALAPTTANGFRIVDSLGPVNISNMAASGSSVVIELEAEPVGEAVVRYGLDYLGDGLIINAGGSGNLRDSTPDTLLLEGIERPLFHVCPHFELPLIELGV